MPSLTEHLSTFRPDLLEAATKHPFLSRAGEGTLTAYSLCKWLVQDKYYQFGYLSFVARMISNLDLDSYAFPKEKEVNLSWKTFETLTAALGAIKDEIDFYNDVVSKYDLQLQVEKPDAVTTKYRRLFEESSQPGEPLVRGLTALWATEYCYLRAWSYAKQQQGESQEVKGAIAALHQAFIPRWTSEEFKEAVDGLAEVLNQWSTLEGDLKRCEELWTEILGLEAEFWPVASEPEQSQSGE